MKLPDTIVFDHQPYGPVKLNRLRLGNYNGHPCIYGQVIEGSETSRLGAHYRKRCVVGEWRTIYGVQEWEVERGRIVRCYCG